MDFAIVEINGKQHKITDKSELEVEHLKAEKGSKVQLDKVLMIVDGEKIKIGTPYIDGAVFEAEIIGQNKGPKIHIRRFRAKSRHRRHIGFRAQMTKISLDKTVAKSEKKAPVKSSVKKIVKKPAK